jgi:hypothetical protein
MFDDYKAVDFTPQIRIQEGVVVAERDASIRLAVGAKHVGMRKDSIATEHFAVVNGIEANGANAVEQLLAQREL